MPAGVFGVVDEERDWRYLAGAMIMVPGGGRIVGLQFASNAIETGGPGSGSRGSKVGE
jgi:hypothetical protein